MSGANLILLFIFTALGFVATGWWNSHSAYVAKQEAELQRFVNIGPRFTAQQGQELCEAVRVLAQESYGYRASGKPLPVCNYYVEGNKKVTAPAPTQSKATP